MKASFTGGDVSSDAGLMLLHQSDQRIGLTRAMAKALPDAHDPDQIEHPLSSLVCQRIYGLATRYEDLNDYDRLRHYPLWQTVVEQDRPLASSPTLCRLENRADCQVARAMQEVIVSQFIGSFAQPPTGLILDFDLTDEPYCRRGEIENRIKEQQLRLFAYRTSCADWWANQFGGSARETRWLSAFRSLLGGMAPRIGKQPGLPF